MILLGFPLSGFKVVVRTPGYTIDSSTMKRDVRLDNLIILSYGAQ
jgi:hypothetical protein